MQDPLDLTFFEIHERFIKPQGSLSFNKYLNDIKGVVDELAIIQMAFDDDRLCLHIINGLHLDLKDIQDVVRTRDTKISFGELFEKPLNMNDCH